MCREHTPFYHAGAATTLARSSSSATLRLVWRSAPMVPSTSHSISLIPWTEDPAISCHTTSFYNMCKSKLAPGAFS